MNKRRIVILGLTSLLLCACSNPHSSKPKAVEISYAEALALAKRIKPKIDSYVRDDEKWTTTAYYFIGDSLEQREVSTLSYYFLPYERYGDIKVVSSRKNTNLSDNKYYSMDGCCLYSKDQNLGYSNYDTHSMNGDGRTFNSEFYYLYKDNILHTLGNQGGSKKDFTSPGGSGSQPLSDAFGYWGTIDGVWQFSTMNVVVLEYFLIDYLALNDVHRTLSCEKHYYSAGEGNLTIEYKIPYTDRIYLPFLDFHYFGNDSRNINEVAKCEFRFGFDDYKPALFDFYLKSNANINPITGNKSDPYETKMKYEFSYEKTNIKQPKLEDYPVW